MPPAVADLIGDRPTVPISIGRSGAIASRVQRPDGDWIVKSQHVHPLETSLLGEAERLRWLGSYVPVPEVVDVGTDGEHEWLVMTALEGSDASDPVHGVDPEHLLRTLAGALRRFHDAVPVDDCPFDAATASDLERARQRVDAGLVDHQDFGPLYQGMGAAELFDVLLGSGIPGDDDPVVLHGDFCVPNVIIDQGRLSGYVDLGRCGVGDRHRDLGIALRSVARNFGAHAAGLFLDVYTSGAEAFRVDLIRLDFFVMLDEFF